MDVFHLNQELFIILLKILNNLSSEKIHLRILSSSLVESKFIKSTQQTISKFI